MGSRTLTWGDEPSTLATTTRTERRRSTLVVALGELVSQFPNGLDESQRGIDLGHLRVSFSRSTLTTLARPLKVRASTRLTGPNASERGHRHPC